LGGKQIVYFLIKEMVALDGKLSNIILVCMRYFILIEISYFIRGDNLKRKIRFSQIF
jgi:hypothetical protein